MVINALNPSSTIDEETKAKVIARLPFSTNAEENENYSVAVYYDAWENDNDDEPVLSLVHSIMKEISSTDSFKEDMQSKNGILEHVNVTRSLTFHKAKILG